MEQVQSMTKGKPLDAGDIQVRGKPKTQARASWL